MDPMYEPKQIYIDLSNLVVWNVRDGRKSLGAVMSLERFKQICRVLRFDNKSARRCTGIGRDRADSSALIQEIFESWVSILPQSLTVPVLGKIHFKSI